MSISTSQTLSSASEQRWRDVMCGEVRLEDVGRRLKLAGWAARRRDHGGVVFVDLRDHTGACQLVIHPDRAPGAAEVAHEVRQEFVLVAEGEVVARAPDAINPALATGEVELQVDTLRIESRSEPLPFALDEDSIDEAVRLRYRYLDLRREQMQYNLRLAARAVAGIRRFMDLRGFVDIWTPNLTKATPEGARDFLVPARLQPGKFFALPQSPQLFKQVLMVSGFDRYYQIATCFRDEDLRADRQFEFRQLDVELAFPTRDDVLDVLEGAVAAAFEALDREPPPRPFPRMSWHEAMDRYGSDKPDLRFGLELRDVTELTRDSAFGVFANAPAVRCLTVPQELSRSDIAALEELARSRGGKGLAYLVFGEDGEVRSPIAKYLSGREVDAVRPAEPGSTVLFGAGEPTVVARALGALRSRLGVELELVDESRDEFLWVVDFPLFEWNEERGRWDAAHHLFTGIAPGQEDELEDDPGAVLSQAYDLVWNGWELGSGSIRIHRSDLQQRVFSVAGITPEEAQDRFGFLLEVMRMGAPPHGGFALGLDRFLALLADEPNIREVVAFPKASSGSELMTGAPTEVPHEQLRELGVRTLHPGR
jgi:aspartyl-tRNA synthetase